MNTRYDHVTKHINENCNSHEYFFLYFVMNVCVLYKVNIFFFPLLSSYHLT